MERHRVGVVVTIVIGGLASAAALVLPVVTSDDHEGWYISFLLVPVVAAVTGGVAAGLSRSLRTGLVSTAVAAGAAAAVYAGYVVVTADADQVGVTEDALFGAGLLVPALLLGLPAVAIGLAVGSVTRNGATDLPEARPPAPPLEESP